MLSIEVDDAEVASVTEEVSKSVQLATTRAVHRATSNLQGELRTLMRRAVPGNAWKMWNVVLYPDRVGHALRPAGEVFANGGRRTQGMVSYWTQPGTNRALSGRWLAVPTKAAGSRGRGRKLTPAEWEQATGVPLIFVKLRNGTAALIAEGTEAKNGSGVLRRLTSRRAAQGRRKTTTVVFVLIPAQKHANSMNMDAAIQRAARELPQMIASELGKIH
jgi:hypothetical protein